MTVQDTIQWDANAVMEHIQMQESRHMQMSALVKHQLMYPDMSIRDFFAMASYNLSFEENDD